MSVAGADLGPFKTHCTTLSSTLPECSSTFSQLWILHLLRVTVRGCDAEHGLLVRLERAPLPDPPAGSFRGGHGNADAGGELAAERGREATEGEGERVPTPQERCGLQLAGQHAPLLLQPLHHGETQPGGALLQGSTLLLRHTHTQVRDHRMW